MVNVLIVNDRPHRLYGMQRTTIEIAEILESAEISTCYCTVGQGPATEEASRRGLHTRQLEAPPNLSAFDKSVSFASARASISTIREGIDLARSIRRVADEENCAVVILATNRLGMLAPLIRGSGRMILVYGQNTIPLGWRAAPSVLGAHSLPQMSPAALRAYPSIFPRAFPQKFPLLLLGIDLDDFRPADHLPSGAGVAVISVAKLSERKGIHILIAAVNLLRRQGHEVRLILVGGPGTAQDEAYVASLQAEFSGAGWIDWIGYSDDVSSHLGRAQIGAIASEHEGGPRVLFEMMASRIVVCSTAVGYVPEVIEDGVDGVIVDGRTAEGFAKAIGKLLEEPELRAQMGLLAEQKANQKYTTDVFAGQLLELLGDRKERLET